MKKTHLLSKKIIILPLFLLLSFLGMGQDFFFNEVDYNIPSGESQFFEVAGPSGTDLTGWQVIIYDETPAETSTYNFPSGTTIPANGGAGCNGIVVVDVAVLNTTAGSGMALVNNTLQVEQYITFETPVTVPGTSGLPIAGLTSQVIPLDSNAPNSSLQLVGTGLEYPAFTWLQQLETPGALNTGQTFLPCPGPLLPVELVDFSGKAIGKNIELQWHTASEVNHSHFEILHSLDGNEFRKIGKVEDAAYESSSLKQYDFVFDAPKVGGNYFRLDQVDLDGSINRSNIIYISYNGFEQQIFIYPNPAQEKIRVVLDKDNFFNNVWIQIIDGQGKIVLDQQMDAINLYSVDISSLENGMYFLRIFSNQQQWQTIFIKEK
jgi:hypothetical protein